MKKTVNQLRAGAVLSYINLGLSSLIPLIYTPIMLDILGKAEYGLYSLASSTISYLSLLSFGLGSTILRYMSMYRAKGEKENERKAFGFFLLLYCAIGAVIMAAGLVISFNIEPIFHRGLTGTELEKMRVLVIIMAFNSGISLPISVFSSVAMAHERYVFRKLVDMLCTIIAPLGNLIALYLGFASVGMAVVSTVIQFTVLPINLVYCFHVLDVRPRFALLPRRLVAEMMGFSVFVFIGSLVDMLFWSTDKLLLGMFASSAAVAVYNVGCTFNTMVINLSTSVSSILMPRVTSMIAGTASRSDLTNLFIRVGRIQYIIVALVISGFSVFGQAFIRLWAGDSYMDSYWIAISTMVPLCIPLIQNTGVSIVTAQNKHQFRSIVYLIIAIINVVATYMVIPYWGGLGAAVCSGLSYIIGQGIVMNIYYWKVTGIDIPLFWRNILKMSVIPIGMLAVGLFANQFIAWSNWAIFAVGVAVYALVYAGLMYALCLNDYEKNLFSSVLSKIFTKKRAR